MSKLSILKKDLGRSAKLTKTQALKLKGGDDKRDRPAPGKVGPAPTVLANTAEGLP